MSGDSPCQPEAIVAPTPASFQRREQRVPTRLLFSYRLPGVTEPVECFSANVSYSGLFLVTHDLPQLGAELEFELREDDGRVVIAGRGVVRWTRPDQGIGSHPPGIGLSFTALDEQNQHQVRALVDRAILAIQAGLDPATQTSVEPRPAALHPAVDSVPWRSEPEVTPAAPEEAANKRPWWRGPF